MKVVLFDADGVLTLPEEMFSVMYSESRGLNPEPFENFFKTQWHDIVTGKKDLKESIAENPELWQWSGTVDELLEYWFKSEDVRNDDMLALIRELRTKDVLCYLATDQERHRGKYMKDVMFKGLFDGYFVSAELGLKKTEPKFFEEILKRLQDQHEDIEPASVIFFDDSQSKVDTAIAAGINGCLYEGVAQAKEKLVNEGFFGNE